MVEGTTEIGDIGVGVLETADGEAVMFTNGTTETGMKRKGELVVGAGDAVATGTCTGMADTGTAVERDGVAIIGAAFVCGGDVFAVGTATTGTVVNGISNDGAREMVASVIVGSVFVGVARTVGNVVASGILEKGAETGVPATGEVFGKKLLEGEAVPIEVTAAVGKLVSGKVSTNGEPDGDEIDRGRLGAISSGSGAEDVVTRTEGVLVEGDGLGKGTKGLTVSGSHTSGDSDAGRALLLGIGKGVALIMEVGSKVPSINTVGNPTGASIVGTKVGFDTFAVGDVPGSTLIEPLLGSSDMSLLFGASDGGTTTKFVGFDVAVGNGSASTVTFVTTLPVVSYVVLSTCPQLFWGSLNIEQNGSAISMDTTHCIRSSTVP